MGESHRLGVNGLAKRGDDLSVSVVVNTAALGPRADHVLGSDGRQRVTHAMRTYALRNFVLPTYVADKNIREVIVVGEWEPGPGYTYIHVPSVHFSSVDALHQRQVGFEASTGDWIIHSHDDHILDPEWASGLDTRADVLIPQRWTRLRCAEGERLNNGDASTEPYISGHCTIYKRAVLEQCPWAAVPAVRVWDIGHTRQIRTVGFNVARSDTMRAWDCEFGSEPWR